MTPGAVDVEPFTIAIPDGVLVDLRRRLEATRWPDEVEGAGWEYGANLAYMRELAGYWATTFDWRARERELNELEHFRATIDGHVVHFVHVHGKGPSPLPIVVTHGWPSTFLELLPLADRLADPGAFGGDPADSFDVVVPSLPGYGFSSRPTVPSPRRPPIHELWHRLMREGLGYERFAAHGGDIGASVTTRLGLCYPDDVVGIHLTAVYSARVPERGQPLTDAERAYLAADEAWERAEGAYSHVQATKPQTLAYGLNDSPVGLAAWIVEKWRTWGDTGGDVESRFSKDELLANVTIYWATETINSSVRLYYEGRNLTRPLGDDDLIRVPTAVAQFPFELVREAHPPREWAERRYDVRRFTRMPRGGHFPALEEPDLLADDIRSFFSELR